MQKTLLFLSLIIFSTMSAGTKPVPKSTLEAKAVTHEIGGGRFGDQLLSYLHAKWISYYYDIPFLYKPFLYSENLALHDIENRLQESHYTNYKNIVQPKYGVNINYEENTSCLYIIPYFPEALSEHIPPKRWYYFPVDWQDEGFKNEIKKLVSPIHPPTFLSLPTDRISVAVHVRLGGGFDDKNTWKGAPLKLPPKSYYKEQIRHIYELLGKKPLYAYIFTDDKSPQRLVRKFQKYTQDLDITYACRTEENAHNLNVLEDFFQMMQFDCLIRAESNYSITAAKVADFLIEIAPAHFTWTGPDSGYVDKVSIQYGKDFPKKTNPLKTIK